VSSGRTNRTGSTAPTTDKPTPPCGASSSSAYEPTRPTLDYLNRRVTAGNSKRDAIRCLKRYLARELYYDVQAILATTQLRSSIAA
jgi:hypothetical protein